MKKRKQFLALILSIILLFTAVPMTVSATSGTCGENLIWSYDDTTKTLTISGTGVMENYESRKAPWYDAYGSSMKKIIIEDGVESIGNNTFYWCKRVQEIQFGKGVTTIGNCAFYGIDDLTQVVIGENVTTINENAFKDCKNLANVTLGDKVVHIGPSAFSNTALQSISIPASVKTFEPSAVSNCKALKTITVDTNNPNYSSDSNGVMFNKDKTELLKYPAGKTQANYGITNGVKIIGDSAFYGSEYLTEIMISSSVTEIESQAFSYCTKLKSIKIPESVEKIGSSAFSNCTELTTADLCEGIKTIGTNAFSGSSITSIVIPDSATSIIAAFAHCKKLTNVKIGNEITILSDQAFSDCESLKSIVIPDNVTEIGTWTFRDCKSLEEVRLGNNLLKIGVKAFENCSNLKKIEIPDSVKTIKNSFVNCTALASVTLGKNVEELTGTFESCKALVSIDIPKSVKEIGENTFKACSNLKDIYYAGSESEWNNIDISEKNAELFNATIHFAENDEHICTFTQWETQIVTTCTSDGTQIRYCTECQKSETKTISSTGHQSGDWELITQATCQAEGKRVQKCTVCGEILNEESISKVKHQAGDWQVTAEPTCQTEGKRVQKCTSCYTILDEETLDKTTHSFGEWTVSVKPTLESGGKEIRQCVHCNYSETRELDKLPNNLKGDANGDGQVTAVDARMVLQVVAGILTREDIIITSADVNGDGSITATDARRILQIVAGLE